MDLKKEMSSSPLIESKEGEVEHNSKIFIKGKMSSVKSLRVKGCTLSLRSEKNKRVISFSSGRDIDVDDVRNSISDPYSLKSSI